MNPTYKYERLASVELLRDTMREREGHYESYESYERGVTMGENSSTMRYYEEEHTGQRRSREGAEMEQRWSRDGGVWRLSLITRAKSENQ